MFTTSIALAVLLIGLALIQLTLAYVFSSKIARQHSHHDEEPSGLAAVLLSVRGCDPSLRSSLIRLLDQDYPDYHIHLVVDHHSDSAWKVVHEIKDEFDLHGRMTIHEMDTPLQTCGLKCSSLVQAFAATDSETEYIVLLDADVLPHSTWLTDVLRPLSDETIGVVTGNQWFETNGSGNAGTLIRSLWNAGAIVPTAIHANPWAGTCAMRMSDVQKAGLDQIWRESVVDDGPIRAAFAPLGLRMHFEPSLIMVNRERCTFNYVQRYVARMLTWSKLYEKTFSQTLVYAAVNNLVLWVTLGILVTGLFAGNLAASLVALAGLVLSSSISVAGYLTVRNGVNHNSSKYGVQLPTLSIGRLVKMCLLVPVTQVVFAIACVRAMVVQQVKWREITYEVKSKTDVRMLRYQPMSARDSDFAQSELSI